MKENIASTTTERNLMVLTMFFFGHLTPNDFVIKCLDCNYTQKNVEPALSPVPQSEGSRIALSVETSNEQKPHVGECI